MAGPISIGDFAKIEFTGKLGQDGIVFDTTDAAKAKEAGIFSEKRAYGPALVVAGKDMVVKGLDEALLGMQAGASKTVTILPEKAYGPRSPQLIRVLPLAEFRKRDMHPAPGMTVELDGRTARVRSVTSGRVTVDLNHPLAGETLVYDLKVAEKIEGTEARAKALLENSGVKGVSAKLSGGKLEVVAPSSAKPEDAQFFLGKLQFVRAAKELIPEITEMEVKETFELQAKPAAEAKK